MKDWFREFAKRGSNVMGSPAAFSVACLMVALWLASGPYFHFSDTWELVINTLTTIVTFLMVFLIQNSQNREIKSLNLKLDELIRAIKSARNVLIDIEDSSEAEIERLEKAFAKKSTKAVQARDKPQLDHKVDPRSY